MGAMAMGAFITHPPLSSDRRASLLLFRLFHRHPPSLCISGCSSPLPLSNEQPAPGHITPTDKMPPLSLASRLSRWLPPSLPRTSAAALTYRRIASCLFSSASLTKSAPFHEGSPTSPAPSPDFHIKRDRYKMTNEPLNRTASPSLAARPVVARPQLSKFPPHSPLSANRLCLRFTHEITRHDRVGIRPAAGQAVVVGRRERNMCLQKEDISFGDVYRLLPATDGRTRGRRQHTNIARGQLGSGSARARACNQKEKVGSLSLPHSNHPLIRAARTTRTFHDASPAPSELLTLFSLLAFF